MDRQQKLGLLAAVGAGAVLGRVFRARPSYSFRHRAVVISGGSRGLGLEIARLLAAEEADLTLLARDADELARARGDLARLGADVHTIACDVTSRDEVEHAIGQVIDRSGRLDVLVNNAGMIQVGPIEHMTLDDFEAAMSVHFRGPLYAMWAALPYMRRQHSGRIVNIASIGGKVPVPHLAPYAASKFALVGLSASLRAEVAKDGIHITTISPGLMRTGSPINATMKGRHAEEFAWFAAGDSMPGLSISARRAARQVIEACREGKAEHIITLPARLAAAMYGVLPDTFVRLASAANRYVLPSPTGHDGDTGRLGRDSGSALVNSRVTALSNRAARRNNETIRPRLADG